MNVAEVRLYEFWDERGEMALKKGLDCISAGAFHFFAPKLKLDLSMKCKKNDRNIKYNSL